MSSCFNMFFVCLCEQLVSDFESLSDVNRMQQIAQLIFENFISSSFDTQLNISAVAKKEIVFDIQNGLIRPDMFERAKKEVQLLLAHDLFPRYVLHLSARVQEKAAIDAALPKVALPRPEIQLLWTCLQKGASMQPSMFKSSTSESFESHDFFSSPGTVLRLIVCSAFITNQKGPLQKVEKRESRIYILCASLCLFCHFVYRVLQRQILMMTWFRK